MIKSKFLAAAAATLLLTACATKEETHTNGTGAVTLQEKFVKEAGSDMVHFGYNRYDLDSESTAILKAQAAFLVANPAVVATIEGHCDERGTREYNMALGERRANAARRFLVANGVAADRLKVVSFGKERPLDAGHTEAAWAANRRAVTLVMGE